MINSSKERQKASESVIDQIDPKRVVEGPRRTEMVEGAQFIGVEEKGKVEDEKNSREQGLSVDVDRSGNNFRVSLRGTIPGFIRQKSLFSRHSFKSSKSNKTPKEDSKNSSRPRFLPNFPSFPSHIHRNRAFSLPSSLGPNIGERGTNSGESQKDGLDDLFSEKTWPFSSIGEETPKGRRRFSFMRDVLRNSLKEANRKLFFLGGFKLKPKTMKEVNSALDKILELGNDFAQRFEESERSLNDVKQNVSLLQENYSLQRELMEQKLFEMQNIIEKSVGAFEEREVCFLEQNLRDQFRLFQFTGLLFGLMILVSSSQAEFNEKCLLLFVVMLCLFTFGDKYVQAKVEFRKCSFEKERSFARTKKQAEKDTNFSVSRERFVSVASANSDVTAGSRTTLYEERRERFASEYIEAHSSSVFVQTEPNKFQSCYFGFNHLEDTGLDFQVCAFEFLSVDQKLCFNQFKEKVHSALESMLRDVVVDDFDIPDDFTILRFLKADKFNQNRALKRLISTIKWRQRSGVKKMLDDKVPPLNYEKYKSLRKRQFLGEDKSHQPIMYEKTGEFFSNALVPDVFSTKQWLECYSFEMAEIFNKFREISVREKKLVHRFVFISDLKGARFTDVRKLSLISTLRAEVETKFPEVVAEIHLVNSPWFLSKVWQLVKTALDPAVVDKIHIHNNFPVEYFQQTLNINIDKSKLC
eukprot:snap_masked-scaffold_54-processed-gene-1.40-mRNA-1 protein AED:0.99 eAED:1.00 QI:0/-1/0/1/-1/1/1/0/695